MKALRNCRLPGFTLTTLALFCCLAMGVSSPASAVDYYVFGQVFQISSEDAADEAILEGDLTGDPLPYHQVRIYDDGTGTLLGRADAGLNGEFTAIFDLPAGSSPDIECRVYLVIDGGAELVPAAREGINSFSSISPFTHVGLRVVSDEDFAYGTAGLVSTPGVGLVFTRVGRVEIPFISQDTTPANLAVAGLADFASDPSRAGELGIPVFRQAPFARRLLTYGSFGLPGFDCADSTHPDYAPQIDWYRINVEKIAEPADPSTYSFLWQDPMAKILTNVTVLPTLTITHTTTPIGPFDGVEGSSDIEGLYFVNRDQVGGVTNLFYSFPDLRMNWVSNSRNGLFRLSTTFYKQTGVAADGRPIVEEIPAGCFAAETAPHRELYVRVNNQGLVASFDHIYLRRPGGGNYWHPSGEVPSASSAFDFNDEGLCDIMDLMSLYEVEIHYTVEHQGGYLRGYDLNARSNDGATNVVFADVDFDPNVTPSDPIWAGPGSTTSTRGGFLRCGFDFDLAARSRLHNGIHYVQWRHPERVYYVDP